MCLLGFDLLFLCLRRNIFIAFTFPHLRYSSSFTIPPYHYSGAVQTYGEIINGRQCLSAVGGDVGIGRLGFSGSPLFTTAPNGPYSILFGMKRIPGEGNRLPWALLLIVDHVGRFLRGFDLDDGEKTAADVRIILLHLYFSRFGWFCGLLGIIDWYYISTCLA